MLRFVAINDYGNRFFMDNVKINGMNILSIDKITPTTYTSIYPNPNKGKFNVKTNASSSRLEIFLHSKINLSTKNNRRNFRH